MSKLLKRAQANLASAKNMYRDAGNDDAFLDKCCFDLQQTIKMILKFLIELSGENYSRVHDIRAHLNHLDDLGVEIPNRTELGYLAQTLNSWEAESRYFDSFFAVTSDIDLAMKYAEDLIDYAESLLKQNASEVEQIKCF